MVVIENVSGRMKTFVLTGKHLESNVNHPHRPKLVKLVTVHEGKGGGGLAMRVRHRPMADSLRLAAGEKRRFEDDAVLHCPHVKDAIGRQEIRVLKQGEAEAFEAELAAAKAEAEKAEAKAIENLPTTRVDPVAVQAEVQKMQTSKKA